MKRLVIYLFAALTLIMANAANLAANNTPKAGLVVMILTADGNSALAATSDKSEAELNFVAKNAADTYQQWLVTPVPGMSDAVMLVNMHSGYAVDFSAENDGNRLLQFPHDFASPSQQIVFYDNGAIGNKPKTVDGTTYTRYLCTPDDPTKWTTLKTADIDKAEKCSFVAIGGKTVVLGMKNDDAQNDAKVDWQEKDASKTLQQWTKEGDTAPFKLINKQTGYALDFALLNGGNPDNTKRPGVWTKEDGSLNQQLYLTADNKLYAIELGTTKYYLTTRTSNLKTTDESLASVISLDGGYITTTKAPDLFTDAPFRSSWVEDQARIEDNKMEAHATFIPYSSTDKMRADKSFYDYPWLQPESDSYMSLNGDWKFKFTGDWKSETLPGRDDFYGDGADVSSWDNIKVPLSWEMAGYDIPIYSNIGYQFKDNPPYVSPYAPWWYKSNPVGSYRRAFTLPSGWKTSGKRVTLHFDGACSAIAVWVNGYFCGYSQGSNNDAEFNVSNYVREGENSVSVRCYHWSDGSYLEGQDMWRLGGIHRDVYLVSTPEVYVYDHEIYASKLSADATSGTLNVALKVRNFNWKAETKIVKVTLRDASGTEVASGSAVIDTSWGMMENTKIVSLEGLTGIHPWSAESPYLYTVEVSQSGDSGEEMAFSTKFGFRRVEIVDQSYIAVNGERVFFKGVNTQDIHPLYGHAIDVETMLKDVIMMKQNNINTVRTSHYPRQAKMNAMMDYYGLYCMDEADIECHRNWIDHSGDGKLISNDATWQTAYVDRVERMVKRDWNHPSIVFWSLGNESGGGQNFQSAYDRAKELLHDRDNIIHYEGENSGNTTYSDLSSNMYPLLSTVEGAKNGLGGAAKPYFICEYAHAMGQAVGNLQEFWDAIESSKRIIGGCIWDWVDQGIYDSKDIKSGELIDSATGYHKFKSGRDYIDAYDDVFKGDFMSNGIVTPDRAHTAKLAEVKFVYKNVEFNSFSAAGKSVVVKNKYNFTNLADRFYLYYNVLADGNIAEEGRVDLPSVAPGAEATVGIPYADVPADASREYILTLALRLKDAAAWAPADYEIAAQQFRISDGADVSQPEFMALGHGSLPEIAPTGKLTLSGNTVSGTDGSGKAFSISFADDGMIADWTYGGASLLVANTSPDYSSFRRIANNSQVDWQDKFDTFFTPDLTATAKSLVAAPQFSGNNVVATAKVGGRNGENTIEYTVYPDGTVDMKVTTDNTKPNVINSNGGYSLRSGITMQFAEGLEQVEYYAKGPWSCYSDRQRGSLLGRYSTTVSDMAEEQSAAQTQSDHVALRDLTLHDASKGVSLAVKTEGMVSFSLSHYDDQQFNYATHADKGHHSYNLTKRPYAYAHFDSYQCGLGNNSCNGDLVLQKYVCPVGKLTFTLRMKAY